MSRKILITLQSEKLSLKPIYILLKAHLFYAGAFFVGIKEINLWQNQYIVRLATEKLLHMMAVPQQK